MLSDTLSNAQTCVFGYVYVKSSIESTDMLYNSRDGIRFTLGCN
jgi:hypothetical protein